MTLPKDIREFKKKYGFGNIPTDKRTKAYKKFKDENNIRTQREFNQFLRNYMKQKPLRDFEKIKNEYLNRPIETINRFSIKKLLKFNRSREEYQEILLRLINKFSNYQINNTNKYVMFSVKEGEERPLNLERYNNLIDAINNDELTLNQIKKDYSKSDAEADIIYKINLIENLEFINFGIYYKTNNYNNAEGAFFPYFLNSNIDLDLSNYQIYKENQISRNFNDNCFIFALKIQGLKENKLEIIKNLIKTQYFRKTAIKQVAENLKICIILHEPRKDRENEKIITKYNKEAKEIYNIGLIENHYFKLEEFKEPIFNNKNSFQLIKYLVKNKDDYLTSITYEKLMISECEKLPKIKYSIDLDFEEKEATKKIEYKGEKNLYDDYDLIYFDFEAYEDENNKFCPYMVSASFGDKIKTFYGDNCGLQFLKALKKNSLLIAHNTKFDISFLMSYFTSIQSEIKNNGSFKELKGLFYKIKIVVRDSYLFIPKKLSEFPECFMTKEEQKEIKKEIMPYKLYNKDTINRVNIPLEEIKKFLSDDDFNEMINNAKKWACIFDYKIDIIRYSRMYCEMDVRILKTCYNKFREWCLKDFNMDILNYITICAFVDAYFKKMGCYNGCYKMGLNVKEFIMNCLNGGRVMPSNNKKWFIDDKIINDFDAVSLYPSAMARMDGFLKGTPKVIRDLNYNSIKNYDGYFLQILIKKVGIKRDFSLMSYKDENGVKQWINEMEEKIIYVDKYTLEDLIEFQKIEFEIIRGYYFNDGFNNQINETITHLFNKRKQLKKDKNPAELIYKLMMNSGYGKTLQKDIDKETKFFNNEDDKNSYISKNYNIINSVINYDNNKWRIEILKPLGNHYNACHIGVMILSMSKRIMNEVMTTAEDNNLKIYYQDTDSIHIEDKNIKILEKIFKDKYKRELIGKDLGQFHSDFNIKGFNGDVVSKGLIILGKKCYIDKLEGVKEDGTVINDYHIRLKGVNSEAIAHKCEELNKNPFQLYMELYKGDEIEFDLTAGGNKAIFKFTNNYNVNVLSDFKRKIKFT